MHAHIAIIRNHGPVTGIRSTELCMHNERDVIYCTPNPAHTEV